MAALNETIVSCLNGLGKCFPLEPCVSDADCFGGRWPCRNNVCFSDLAVFSQAYFSMFLVMSLIIFTITVCPTIFFYGRFKKSKRVREEKEADERKKGSKADQLRRSLVPAMTFTPSENPMFNGQQQQQQGFASNSQSQGRDDDFYTEKIRGGGLVNAAGMNFRQSVMLCEAPQIRADAMARQQQQQQFGGMAGGNRASVMYKESVEPVMQRMGRAVSRMYTERQMGSVLSSAQTDSMPDLDKIYRHADLCADVVARDEGAKTMNINVRALQDERFEAVRLYRLLANFLKLLALDQTALNKVKDRISAPVTEVSTNMNEGMKSNGNIDKQRAALQQSAMTSRQLVMALTAMEGPFSPFNGAENWRSDSAEMLALEEYVADCAYLFDEINDEEVYTTESSSARCFRKTATCLGVADSIRLHPVFYFFFFFVQISLIFSFFVGKCDLFPNVEEFAALNVTPNGLGSIPAHVCLLGKTRTYFGIGEQYAEVLGKGTQADISIPLLYGIMHQLLFLFGTLPVPMARGFWRDVAYYIPFMKKVFPIDTAYFFHQFVGYMALGSLFLGATIWIFEMGIVECLNGPFKSTCTAFDLRNVKNFFDPIENVVFLRVLIVAMWSTLVPLMRWRGEPPFFLPQIVKKYWFEFVYFSHIVVALLTFILAEIARFAVFFPVLATWFLYILDTMRETLFMTFYSKINMSQSFLHTDPSEMNKPTTMTIRFYNPERNDARGGGCRKYMVQGVGKWVYLKVPSVSNLEWHPFSLASADGDDFLQLQIGIRPGQPGVGRGVKDSWELKENSYNGDKQWIQNGGESWTYKLYQAMRNAKEDIPVIFRGPYGSTFSSVFDPSTKGAIIIGAGTGLSAVESCLRAMFHRKRTGQYVPPHLWVMWQTRRVGDLLWLWDSLNQLLIEALNDGTLQKSKIWSPNKSQYVGFLGLTFFISRADQNQLDTLRSMPRANNDTHNLHPWLTNRSRILQSSIASEKTHIRKYVKHVRAFLNRSEGRTSRLAIGFCGPTPVAKIISDAASDYAQVEFSYATE